VVGHTISHYRILDKLGEGGMGVVYRAQDTRLNRDVAVKLLPDSLAHDRQRMARFQREAHMLAQLDHPNIAGIHGVEEFDGRYALVMELAEGPTLADRFSSGPIPPEEALPIARQIAEALEAAHEKGIIHRDLKPANIKVDADGNVRVLDFGLAKAIEGDSESADPASSPTLTMAATRDGIILGTAGYMSPEQACGRPADKRSDVWSFGVVLYEMLTGRGLFGGESVSDTLAGVLKTELDWSALPAGTPPAIRHLLRRCLERERRQRLQAIGEARIILEVAIAGKAWQETLLPVPASRRKHIGKLLLVLAAAGLLLSFAAGFFARRPAPVQEPPVRTFTIAKDQQANDPVISPDGRHIAYTAGIAGQGALWVQDLDRNDPRRLVPPAVYGIFWSPDSSHIGYVKAGELKRISVDGGPEMTICKLPGPFGYIAGAAWGPGDGSIVFASYNNGRLYAVAAAGGLPKLLIEPDENGMYLGEPVVVPGRASTPSLLVHTAGSDRGQSRILLRDLKSGRKEALAAGSRPAYSPSGYVVFSRQNGLWALPVSPGDLRPTGDAFPIRQNASQPSVARDGTLVYLETSSSAPEQLVWKDRRGQKLENIGQPQDQINTPHLSPDGKKVAVWGREQDNDDIWIQDAVRGLKTRLTTDSASEDRPIWSPDGRKIAYASNRTGNFNVFVRTTDGSGQEEPLLSTPDGDYVMDWSRDGEYLVVDFVVVTTSRDIGYVRSSDGSSPKKVTPLIKSEFNEGDSSLSPDGRYLAYSSNESGRFEVYVQKFPAGGDKVQVSVNGGVEPRWRRDGKELFYVEGETLIAVPVTASAGFSAGKPERLFEHKGIARRPGQQYDVAPGGQRFVVIEPVGAEPSRAIRVVQNWFAEFRNRNR